MANFSLSSVYDYNMCTYYLLPLLKTTNKFRFGPKNFRQCYLNRQGTRLYVEVVYFPSRIEYDEHYLGNQIYKGHLYLIFELPAEWQADVELFREGKYSRLSAAAKERIRTYSGLNYNRLDPESGKPFTDVRLMAIDDDPVMRDHLRQILEEELNVRIAPDQELISPPTDQNYIDDLIQEPLSTIPAVSPE